MGNADKRSVATDALETLGTIIDSTAGRDAIHLAVEPVVAAHRLFPGQDVGLTPEGASSEAVHVGIVDPFLKGPAHPGQMFWLVVYPRQITSLRHVWTHPAFGDEAAPAATPVMSADEAWLRNYASAIGEGFDTLMDAAATFLETGEYFYGEPYNDGDWTYFPKFEGESTNPEFWTHYERYRGVTVPEGKKHNFFTCSC